MDPLSKKYPWYTPYQFAGNKPTWKVDLDGLEEADPEEGREEKEELIEEQARIREFSKLRFPTESEREKERKEFEESSKDPAGSARRFREALNNYGRNAFNSAEGVFGGNAAGAAVRQFNIRQQQLEINKANAQVFERVITTQLKNANSGQIASQVTLLVTGQLNGQNVSVRIRIDNISNNNGILNLYEAKYSVEQITGANFSRTLTGNQQTAFDLFTGGTNVNIFVRGNGAKELQIPSGTNITGRIGDIKVVANNTQGGQPQDVKTINVPATSTFQNKKD